MTTSPKPQSKCASKDIAGSELSTEIIKVFVEWREHVESLKKWDGKLPTARGVELVEALIAAHDTEKKQQILKAMKDEKLVIPDYPAVDDEGEPLWSKRAAKEGRKQVTARYHARNELRAELRQAVEEVYSEGGE